MIKKKILFYQIFTTVSQPFAKQKMYLQLVKFIQFYLFYIINFIVFYKDMDYFIDSVEILVMEKVRIAEKLWFNYFQIKPDSSPVIAVLSLGRNSDSYQLTQINRTNIFYSQLRFKNRTIICDALSISLWYFMALRQLRIFQLRV